MSPTGGGSSKGSSLGGRSSGGGIIDSVRGSIGEVGDSAVGRPSFLPLVLLLLAIIVVIAIAIWVFGALLGGGQEAVEEEADVPMTLVDDPAQLDVSQRAEEEGVDIEVVRYNVQTESGEGRVSFSAVGDNIMNIELLEKADANAGVADDGKYDFTPFYEKISDEVSSYDISFINQETVLGSDDDFAFAGYPSFNTPDDMYGTLVDAGWDIVNCNSNHTYDIGSNAIEHQIELMEDYEDMVNLGMYGTEEEAKTIQVVDVNGISIAFLSYNQFVNGLEADQVEDGSLVNLIDDEKLERDIPKAASVADVVVVSMHWGDEYVYEPNDYQQEYAQKCADLGADLVIGTHSHSIQPTEWLEGKDGNKCLVAYCLGDFASHYTWVKCIFGYMLTCDFVKDDSGDVGIENVVLYPTVEHAEGDDYYVYLLKDYTPEMAAVNELFNTYNEGNTPEMSDDPYGYIVATSEEVLGDEFKVMSTKDGPTGKGSSSKASSSDASSSEDAYDDDGYGEDYSSYE